jgi:hypothetical protein
MVNIPKFITKLLTNIPEGHKFYSGEFGRGEADYVYIQKSESEEHELDGSFQYECYIDDDSYERAEGEFDHDIKSGHWSMYYKTIDGHSNMRAYFVDGVLHGDVLFSMLDTTHDVNADLSFSVFDCEIGGRISGHLPEGGIFTALCDDNGYPDGVWKVEMKAGRKTVLTKQEVWNHGHLVEAYEEDSDGNRKPIEPYMRDSINSLLMNDVTRLLHIITRGIKDDTLLVRTK